MAVAISLGAPVRDEVSGVRAIPPPIPVSLRLEAEPWAKLPRELVRDLRFRLTNNEARGDTKDNGHGVSSLFKELIDDESIGVISGDDWWAITVWPAGSRPGPVAWCLLRPEGGHRTPTFRIGSYTAPEWRSRGIGRMMVNEAARLAHRFGFHKLTASPWNKRSESFFKSAGFDIIVSPSGGGMSGLAEMYVNSAPARVPWRCRPPEV